MRLLIFKITLVLIACFMAVTLYFDNRLAERSTELTALKTLEDSAHMLLTLRQVYRERIQQANLPITKDSIRLCPGSVIGEMASRYDIDGSHGISFGNVSDRPRNPLNQADPAALLAIEHFRSQPDAGRHFSSAMLPGGQRVFQLALPLWTEAPCLACHGPKEETLPLVQAHYNDGFGYQLGDLRGVLLARISADKARSEELWHSRLMIAGVSAICLFLTLWLAFDRFVLARLRLLADAVAALGQGVFRKLPPAQTQDEVGAVLAGFNVMVDAIHAREAELDQNAQTIATQKRFLGAILDSLHDPVLVIAADYRVLSANEAARRLFHRDAEAVTPMSCYAVLHGLRAPCDPAERVCPLREALRVGETVYLTHTGRNAEGEPVLYDVSAKPLFDAQGKISGVVESLHDVTALIQNEAELRLSRERLNQQAHSDPLTGLPNRRSFEEMLAGAVEESQLSGRSLALAFLDLDGFKDVNDALGHPVGDELLRTIAQRLRNCARASDFVGRLAGDEFVVVVLDQESEDGIQRIAEKVLAACAQALTLAGNRVQVTASIGIAFCPDDALRAEDLIKAADIAMYSAKAAGRNCIRYYARDMDEAVRNRFALGSDLQAALAHKEFFLVYQPQFAGSGQLRGVEALMRWQSPARGLVSPDEFIPVLESSGLIRQTGIWLLNESLGQLRAWLDRGMPELVMSINVSASEFEDPGFVERIVEHLHRYAIPPYLLELEITERLALNNLELTINQLGRLRALGIRAAMDDFGTGYSSLSYLARLPIDTLKIDRSFVRTLPESAESLGVIRLIVGLARLMNMEIVAEGVEVQAELDGVKEAGCDYVQGYYYSRPLPPDEVFLLECTRSGTRPA